MMNFIRTTTTTKSPKISSSIAINSTFSILKPKKGNSNPIKIQSFSSHSSTNQTTTQTIKNVDDAVTLFHQMLQMKPSPSIYDFISLFNIVVKMKQYSHVVVMFKKLSLLGFPVNVFVMNTLINCYCHLKEVKMGFAVVGVFVKLGYDPDIVSVNCLIKGILVEAKGVSNGIWKNRMIDDAIGLLSKMIGIGISPNVVTYTTLIQGLCSFKRWGIVDMCLKQMVDNRIRPDIVTFTALVNAYCKEGLMKNAEEVVRSMIEIGVHPNVFTYTALMDGYCLRGLPDKAEELLNLMEEKGLEPDLVCYSTVVNGFCKHKDINRAWEIFEEMPRKGLKRDTTLYSCMIQGLFSVGRCCQALELYNEMKVVGLGYNIYTYGIVLDGLLCNGKIDDATSLYHEVDSKGLVDHVGFHTIFIHELCNNDRIDLARSIFNSLSSKGLYPNVITYTVMIKGLCQKGMLREVKELLEKMEKNGCFPNRVTYNVIIQGCLKHSDSVDSLNILTQISEKNFTLDSSAFSIAIQQMQGSGEDLGRKSLIQKLISNDSRRLMA